MHSSARPPPEGGARRARPLRLAGVGLALGLGGLGLWLGGGRLAPQGWLVGGEAGVRRALASQARLHLQDPGGTLSLDLEPIRFAEISASVEGPRATVVAMVEAEGRVSLGGAPATVRYVGRERFHLSPCGPTWCPEADELSGLRGVVEALAGRHDALLSGAPGRRVLGWQIRVERESAEAGEDFETPGPGGVPTRERARLSLRQEAGRWTVAP